MTTTKAYVVEALDAIMEDVFGRPSKIPFAESPSAFLEPEQLALFADLVAEEFSVDVCVDDAETFNQLVVDIVAALRS